MITLSRLPVVLLISFGFSIAAFVPAVVGFATDNSEAARNFLYAGILSLGICMAVALAVSNRDQGDTRRTMLLTLLFPFTVVPFALAVPFAETLRTTTYANAYLDMVSAITTTALPTFELDRLSQPLMIWRSLVAWMGGLLMWTFAWVLLMPMRLGGYEISPMSYDHRPTRHELRARQTLAERFLAELKLIGPMYTALTLVAWIALTGSGMHGYDASIFAMGAVSTAGYQPNDVTDLGFGQEVMIFLTLCFAVTRQCFGDRFAIVRDRAFWRNSELRLAFVVVLSVATLLFARQFVGAATVDTSRQFEEAAQAFWGGLYTALSFLTTTGYTSFGWDEAQSWSGLANPTVILLALSLIGGGVATSAGGIKLLRMASLMQHSGREIAQLAEPKRIIPSRRTGFSGNIQNAVWAWVFFMSFFASFALVALCLA
ncbi:MAG: potassium transporter TrkG, partial [Pseudomonadota bacterium]